MGECEFGSFVTALAKRISMYKVQILQIIYEIILEEYSGNYKIN